MLTDQQRAEILIGDDAENFVQSELGQTVLGMAKQDAEAAMLRFQEADITDTAKLMDIKVELRVAQRFDRYLAELITRGREVLDANKQQ